MQKKQEEAPKAESSAAPMKEEEEVAKVNLKDNQPISQY